MRLGDRLKKMEKDLLEIRAGRGQLRMIWQNCGESQEQALKRADLYPEPADMTIYVMHWATKPVPGSIMQGSDDPPATAASLDAEIERLKAQLEE